MALSTNWASGGCSSLTGTAGRLSANLDSTATSTVCYQELIYTFFSLINAVFMKGKIIRPFIWACIQWHSALSRGIW